MRPKVTFKDINEALGTHSVVGYTDGRKYGRRLKLDRLLCEHDATFLLQKLHEKFHLHYTFSVEPWMWVRQSANGPENIDVTVVKVFNKPPTDTEIAWTARHAFNEACTKPVDLSPKKSDTDPVMKITKSTNTVIEVKASDLIERFSIVHLDIANDMTDDPQVLADHLITLADNLKDLRDGNFAKVFVEGYTMMLLPCDAFDYVEDYFVNARLGETIEIQVVDEAGNVVDTVLESEIVY